MVPNFTYTIPWNLNSMMEINDLTRKLPSLLPNRQFTEVIESFQNTDSQNPTLKLQSGVHYAR